MCLERKLTLTSIFFFQVRVDHEKYASLCLHPVKLCLYFAHSAAPNPLDYVVSLVLYSPLEAGIGRNVSGWRYRRSSTLNDIGGAATRAFFKLVEC